jgi:hypothetical protein
LIKLRSREWLTRDLFVEWLKPGASARLDGAGEVGINPDQRVHEDARRLSELSADLGIGLLQASLLLLSFLGVLWSISGALDIWICGISLRIPGYMVWCALLYAASGSWLTWRVGRPLVGMNSRRYQHESAFRFALFQANQQMHDIASLHHEEEEKRRLGLDLEKVLVMVREIIDATARLTWITAGYGWISIVAPIVIASPPYFSGRLSFGELMVAVGGFYQVNRSSINQIEPMARSPGPISSSTPSATVTPAPRAKSLFNSDAHTPFPEAASQPRAQDSIAPANWIAMSASSKPSAARTLLPARSRGIWTKMLATWPARMPQVRNTWRPVAVGRKSRCCSPISSGFCA